YQAASKIVEIGYAGARERAHLLERLALNDQDWVEYQAQREARRRPVPVPQFVEVTGTAPVVAEGIEKSLAGVIGKPIDYMSINRQLTDVTGLGRFSRAGFEMIRRGDIEGLRIRADEKDYAPPTVNPLFVIDGSDYTDVRFSLGARITFNDIGGFGSELRNDFIVGTTYGVASEYYHPVNWFSHFFAAPRLFRSS